MAFPQKNLGSLNYDNILIVAPIKINYLFQPPHFVGGVSEIINCHEIPLI